VPTRHIDEFDGAVASLFSEKVNCFLALASFPARCGGLLLRRPRNDLPACSADNFQRAWDCAERSSAATPAADKASASRDQTGVANTRCVKYKACWLSKASTLVKLDAIKGCALLRQRAYDGDTLKR
jgi:hypothetical protein